MARRIHASVVGWTAFTGHHENSAHYHLFVQTHKLQLVLETGSYTNLVCIGIARSPRRCMNNDAKVSPIVRLFRIRRAVLSILSRRTAYGFFRTRHAWSKRTAAPAHTSLQARGPVGYESAPPVHPRSACVACGAATTLKRMNDHMQFMYHAERSACRGPLRWQSNLHAHWGT